MVEVDVCGVEKFMKTLEMDKKEKTFLSVCKPSWDLDQHVMMYSLFLIDVVVVVVIKFRGSVRN